MGWMLIIVPSLVAGAYLLGEQSASRALNYGAERPFWTLGPYWIVKAWFRR